MTVKEYLSEIEKTRLSLRCSVHIETPLKISL